MTEPRIPPLEPPYAPEVAEAIARLMPPGIAPLTLFRTLAVNQRVFLRLVTGGLLDRGSLSLRDRELVIDRTCFRCGSEYEWGVHVALFAAKAKLTPQEIQDLCADDPATTVFSPRDRLLLELCDQLHATARVSDALWAALSAEWSAEQLIELIALAGYYHAISFATNVFRLAPESFAARFGAPVTPSQAGRPGQ
jgi:alkylhydroperoxidase family enzyme